MSRNPRLTMPCRPPSSARQRGVGHSTIEAAGATATVCRPRSSTRPGAPSAIKSSIPKRGPPPAPPKRIDYKRPGMTRAMEQRMKHTQQLQEQLDRRERERAQAAAPPPRRSRRPDSRPRGRSAPTDDRGRYGPGRSREPSPTDGPGTCPMPATQPCPASSKAPAGTCPTSRVASTTTCPRAKTPVGVPARTLDLAKSINADVVKAEPLENGPIDNLIIPPGAINSEKTTVISIPQPEKMQQRLPSSTLVTAQQQTNRSAQVMSETLDEQDAAESAMVQSKLQDLQQARREFVLAVANISGNGVTLQDDDLGNLTPISEVTPPPFMATQEPSSPRLIACPDLDDPYLQVEYHRHHPVVEAAREYMRSRQTERYVDEDFTRFTSQPPGSRNEGPYQQQYLDAYSDEDDAAERTVVPRRAEAYPYLPMPVERLERFFDLQNYPPPPATPPTQQVAARAPPGRECLPPDLWEVEDFWYREPEVPDLIDWNDY